MPGMRGLVPRYTHIRYRGLDAEGKPVDRKADGFHARVVTQSLEPSMAAMCSHSISAPIFRQMLVVWQGYSRGPTPASQPGGRDLA